MSATAKRRGRPPKGAALSPPGVVPTDAQIVGEEEAPRAGHNNPPTASLDLTAEQWTEWLKHVFEQAAGRKDELLASFKRFENGFPIRRNQVPGEPPVGIEKWSDDIQGRAGDLRDKLRALVGQAEALHKLEKAPVLVATRAIDGFLRSFKQALDDALTVIRDRQTVYAQWQEYISRERARDEAEARKREADAAAAAAARTLEPAALDQAAQAAQEAAEAQSFAAAKPAEHTRAFGELGSVTSLRDNWQFVAAESDLMTLVRAVIEGKAPLSYLAFNTRRIELAIRTEKIREIPGCVIRNEAVAR